MEGSIQNIPNVTYTKLKLKEHEIRLLRIDSEPGALGLVHVIIERVDFLPYVEQEARDKTDRDAVGPSNEDDEDLDLDGRDDIARVMKTRRADDRYDLSQTIDANQDDSTHGSPIPTPYTALSYMWGTEQPLHHILLSHGDKRGLFLIRQNLFDYLTMRGRKNDLVTDAGVPRWLWIDQLCTDQSNGEEKGHQVQLMAGIYSSAHKVDIWLGPKLNKSDALIHFLNRHRSRFIEHIKSGLVPFDFKFHDEALEESQANTLILSPYWSRLWIQQEVILAKHTTVYVGSASFSDAWLFSRMSRVLLHDLYSSWDGFLSALYTIEKLVHKSATVNSWQDLQDIGRGTLCQDPKDKAFGVLELVAKPFRITPDYSMSHQDILFAVIEKQIASGSSRWDNERGSLAGCYFFILFVEGWAWALGGPQTIDFKALRVIIRDEVYGSRNDPHSQSLSWKDRIYLWWWFPSKHSVRWLLVDESRPGFHNRKDAVLWWNLTQVWRRVRLTMSPHVADVWHKLQS